MKKKIVKLIYLLAAIFTIVIAILTLWDRYSHQEKANNTEDLIDKQKEDITHISEVIEYKTESFLDRKNSCLNGHDYVNLGLSVNWATCNVGSTHPEDNGQKYAWGETTPKPSYTWVNYDFFKYEFDQEIKFSKYEELYDKKETLELSDDAANDSWGAGWRIPTKTEFLELINNCTWSWVSQKGVKGYKFTSKKKGFTDKSIFFPIENDSSTTTYWSNLVKHFDDKMAWGICFEATPVTPYARTEFRFEGHPVRPVCKVK